MLERDSPLTALAGKLRKLGPPSLSVLVAVFEDAEEYQSFVSLVRELLLEREQEILREPTPTRQMAAFATHFEDRYFPLDRMFLEGFGEGYSDLTRRIPVIPLGISWEDYHYMVDFRPGYQLMSYLSAAPGGEDEARIAIGELCADHVSIELLESVPAGGLPREEIRPLLKGTPYEALADWADILEWDTGNFFLDTSYDELWQMPFDFLEWDRGAVEQLTREWLRADEIQEKISNLALWLEEDPPERFRELVNFILERRGNESRGEG